MMKKIFISGLAGAVVLLVWTFILNGLLGFNARLSMKQVPYEQKVYDMLKATISEPGRYLCNPALTPDGRFPENEPVFGIHYSGVGHEAAGLGALFGLLQFLIVPFIGAWLLSKTCDHFQSRFINRLWFFVVIGFLVAITGDLSSFGIGGSPLTVALIFAARTMVTWVLIGTVIATLMRPQQQAESVQ